MCVRESCLSTSKLLPYFYKTRFTQTNWQTYMTWRAFTLYSRIQDDSLLDFFWSYQHFNLESPFVDEAWYISLFRSTSLRLEAIATNFNHYCRHQNFRWIFWGIINFIPSRTQIHIVELRPQIYAPVEEEFELGLSRFS